MEIVAIVLSLFLLVTFAYRGFSVILFAPIFALFAASFSGLPILPGYTELFMAKAVTYIKSFFPVFLLGAVFGKVMEETGMARSIAMETIKLIGNDKAVFAVVFACMILCYGGISMFVCAFAVYPFCCCSVPRSRYSQTPDSGLLRRRCLHGYHGLLSWFAADPEYHPDDLSGNDDFCRSYLRFDLRYLVDCPLLHLS